MHINITEAEQKILNLLWEEGCFSTMQITDKLKNESGWSKQAVISFLKEWKLKSLGLFFMVADILFRKEILEHQL